MKYGKTLIFKSRPWLHWAPVWWFRWGMASGSEGYGTQAQPPFWLLWLRCTRAHWTSTGVARRRVTGSHRSSHPPRYGGLLCHRCPLVEHSGRMCISLHPVTFLERFIHTPHWHQFSYFQLPRSWIEIVPQAISPSSQNGQPDVFPKVLLTGKISLHHLYFRAHLHWEL